MEDRKLHPLMIYEWSKEGQKQERSTHCFIQVVYADIIYQKDKPYNRTKGGKGE
ncbi:MAG: hypothetical protein ACFFCW_25090 [Candidatus Hodarchaeota archaeon]